MTGRDAPAYQRRSSVEPSVTRRLQPQHHQHRRINAGTSNIIYVATRTLWPPTEPLLPCDSVPPPTAVSSSLSIIPTSSSLGGPSSAPPPARHDGDNQQKPSDRGGSAHRPGTDSFELGEYTHVQARQDADARDTRRGEKRERKRQWLLTQDEMKFSHSIQFNAVPDWSSHYIAYSNLKKL